MAEQTQYPLTEQQAAQLEGLGMSDPKYRALLEGGVVKNPSPGIEPWEVPEAPKQAYQSPYGGGFLGASNVGNPDAIDYAESPAAYVSPPAYDPSNPTGEDLTQADPNELLGPTRSGLTPDQQAAQNILNQQQVFDAQPYDAMKKAIEHQANIQNISMQTQSDLLEKQNQQIADVEAKRQDSIIKRGAELEEATAEMDAMSKEIGATEIDPKGFWAKKSTGEKIMAGIVMAIAGYAQGAYGTPNNAMSIFQKAMDDDVNAQRANLGIKKGELGDKKTAYQQMLGKYKDDDMAMAGAKMAIIEQTKTQVAATAGRAKGEGAQAKAAEMIAGLDLQKQQQMQAFQAAQNKAMGQTGSKAEYFIKDFGVARNKIVYQKLYDSKKSYNDSSAVADTLVNKINKFSVGNKVPYDKMRKEIETLTISYRGIMREGIIGPGAITESERALIEKAIPEGTGWTDASRDEAITAIRTIQEVQKRQLHMEAEEAIPGYQAPYTRQKNGAWRQN